MSELISGKEALIALANGEEVEFKCGGISWSNLDAKQQPLEILIDKNVVFRLKPRTIMINNIEVPAPFDVQEGDKYWSIDTDYKCGYAVKDYLSSPPPLGAWRTEDEIKQVVAALHEIFK